MKKIIASILGTLILITGTAFAQVTDDAVDTGTSYCPNLRFTIFRGMNDFLSAGQVSELQKFLNDYYDLNLPLGSFGRLTQAGVVKFQKEMGLPSYGIVGSATRAAIARVCNNSTASTNSSSNTNIDTTNKLTGYYTVVEKSNYEMTGSTAVNKCDSFVVTAGDPKIISMYKQRITNGNTLQKIDANGNLVINIDFESARDLSNRNVTPSALPLSSNQISVIKNSNASNQVLLDVYERKGIASSVHSCYSLHNIENVQILNSNSQNTSSNNNSLYLNNGGSFSVYDIVADKSGVMSDRNILNFGWKISGNVPKNANITFFLKRKSDGAEGYIWPWGGKRVVDGKGEFSLNCVGNCIKNSKFNNDEYLLVARVYYCEDQSRENGISCELNPDGSKSGYKIITKDVSSGIYNRDSLIYKFDGYQISQFQE